MAMTCLAIQEQVIAFWVALQRAYTSQGTLLKVIRYLLSKADYSKTHLYI